MPGAQRVESFEARRRLAGTRLGNYDVGARLGSGGSASVFLARGSGSQSDGRVVALKVVHDHLTEEGDFIGQFLDEANLLKRLTHENIVQVHEFGSEGDTLYLAMEYLHGQPLSRLVNALSKRGERMPPELVAHVGACVARALGFAHGLSDNHGKPLGLVHRDVSPQNLFITYDGRVKLIDFGIARAARRIAQTTVGRIKGKFSYMAPEQLTGRAFDHRVDLFALGATLHEAAAGARLFTGADADETVFNVLTAEVPDLHQLVPGFPEDLSAVLKKSLSANPDDRFQSGTDMARAFDACAVAAEPAERAAKLGELVSRACAEEKADAERAIEELGAVTDTRTHDTVPAPAPSSPPLPRGRLPLGPVVAVLALVAVVVWLGAGARRSGSAPAPTPSVAASVAVEITTLPETDARITLAGRALGSSPARVVLARGETPVEVLVEATGFETARTSFVPDRDRTLAISLVKTTPVPSAAAAGSAPGPVAPTPTRQRVGHALPSAGPTPTAPSATTTAPPPTPLPTQSAPLHL